MITATAHGRVSLLEIDRPERRNALDTATCDQLREAVLGGVDAGARAVVIGGGARRMMLAAQRLDVAEAVRCGLVDIEGGLDEALALAQGITELAPLSVAYSKRVLNTVGAIDDEWAEAELTRCWTSADFAEGQLARSENRAPEFQGR